MQVTPTPQAPRALIIGAGIAGLACAMRLRVAGYQVSVLERHGTPGGKIRTVPSVAGPIDAGPTVLTMRHVFDDLFALFGERLEDHVRLIKQDVLARHFWPDGNTLDLCHDEERNMGAVRAFAGDHSAAQFLKFSRRARRLFAAFDQPMMQAADPQLATLTSTVLKQPGLIPAMAPLSTLRGLLRSAFDDPRLRQLFGRYATYVGGSPSHAPGLLALIWQAEAAGVWVVEGGMHKLVEAIAALLRAHDVTLRTDADVARIELQGDRVAAVCLGDGTRLPCDVLVHAGDPRALATGALGPGVSHVARVTTRAPRSFSARVLSFAATPSRDDLVHHNVFFQSDPDAEFRDVMAGRVPAQPSCYICALDRGQGRAPPPVERFEIITNAPATDDTTDPEDLTPWLHQITQQMAQFGMTFSPKPTAQTVTTPQAFARMFPGSLGALYGQSPHGMTAALKRPRARTQIPNLYLAGGGTHPGAGVPMATLSARHAVEAILSDQTSMSVSAPTAMRGGMSTG
ncbi:1-hydroxycarotenoid 3,4-desaturase CrtD [Tateyamaria sp. SN6-1]|uniref:1-hydroxycarotenoid 3,4-desaturase CrtD n=1 Tax=Tateyamaria sp. SN6-1 TaxID=3092148 RepID=UPI0039F48C9B